MYVLPLASLLFPLGRATEVEIVPAGHWLHCLALESEALNPTLHGLQARPPILAVPGEQATQVPAVAAVSEDSRRYPFWQART